MEMNVEIDIDELLSWEDKQEYMKHAFAKAFESPEFIKSCVKEVIGSMVKEMIEDKRPILDAAIKDSVDMAIAEYQKEGVRYIRYSNEYKNFEAKVLEEIKPEFAEYIKKKMGEDPEGEHLKYALQLGVGQFLVDNYFQDR